MPLVKVSLLKGKSKEEKEALLNAIHAALIEAFKTGEF
jgi:phenylpyruvate tautomerase PptA (4-oxalocrotonate tautomerase family)